MDTRSMMGLVVIALIAGFGAGIGGAMIMMAGNTPTPAVGTPTPAAGGGSAASTDQVLEALEDIRELLAQRDRAPDVAVTNRLDTLINLLGDPQRQPTAPSGGASPPRPASPDNESLARLETLLQKLLEAQHNQPGAVAGGQQLDPTRAADAPVFRHTRSQRLYEALTREGATADEIFDEMNWISGLLSQGDAECYQLVRRALLDHRPEVQSRALEMLNSHGLAPPVDELDKLLQSNHDELRKNSLEALSNRNTERAARALLGYRPADGEATDYAYGIANQLAYGESADPRWPAELLADLRARSQQYPVPETDDPSGH